MRRFAPYLNPVFAGLVLALAAPESNAQTTVSITTVPVDASEASGSRDFVLTRSAPTTGTTTVGYSVGGTATLTQDYVRPAAVAGSICGTATCIFGPGVTTMRIRFTIVSDIVHELDDTIVVNLDTISDDTNASAFGVPITGTNSILNDDAAPSLRINDVIINEGVAGGTASFTVTRTGQTALSASFGCTHAPSGANPASSPGDYGIAICSGSIPAGGASATTLVTVSVVNDPVDEFDETFDVTLDTPVNATISAPCGSCLTDGVGRGTVQDNDALPIVQINDPGSIPEGDAGVGSVNVAFAVTLSAPSAKTVTVTATALDGTAKAGSPFDDYSQPAPTVLTFTPGSVTPTVPFSVAINGDLKNELNETFRVTLSAASNAQVPVGNLAQGDVTIVDNDAAPTVSITPNPASVTEGGIAGFNITLSAASGKTVSVRATASNGTATTAASDYVNPGNIIFTFLEGGALTQTYNVTTLDDPNDELDATPETFNVTLSLPVNTSIPGTNPVQGLINDNEADGTSLTLRIDDQTVVETGSTQSVTFSVVMSGTSFQPVSFTYSTADGPLGPVGAVAPGDYAAQTAVLRTINPGSTTNTFSVQVNGDALAEGPETYTVTIAPVTNATVTAPCGACTTDGVGVGTIINDDPGVTTGLAISEFRLRGPASDDEFIEVANTTASPILVATAFPNLGFVVRKSDNTPLFTIPNGTVIPVGGTFLGAHATGYGLSNYGGIGASSPDATWATDIDETTTPGIALFADATLTTVIDAVGFAGAPAPYFEGTPLPVSYSSPGQYSHPRNPSNGIPIDYNNNATDFFFVAVAQTPPGPGPLGPFTPGGPLPVLGSPGPRNLSSPVQRNGSVVFTPVDPLVGINVAPNREFSGTNCVFPLCPLGRTYTGGSILIRRTLTNPAAPGGPSITKLRFRVAEITTLNAPPIFTPNQSDARFMTPFGGVFLQEVGVPVTGNPSPGVTLEYVQVEGVPGMGSEGGGLNSSGTIGAVSLATPLPPGASINVTFMLAFNSPSVPGPYYPFRLLLNIEALEQ